MQSTLLDYLQTQTLAESVWNIKLVKAEMIIQ